MLRNLSFRQKLLFSQILVFIFFFAALFPIVEKVSEHLVRDSLIDSTSDLKTYLQSASSEEELISLLKNQTDYTFYRMVLINDKGLVIYDSRISQLEPYPDIKRDEVEEAFEKGVGYTISVSETFGKKFAYVAESFKFQGRTYVLRTAFPYEQIKELVDTFEIGVLIFSFLILLVFNLFLWFIFNRLSQPIREIIQAITPYQKGEQADMPEISILKTASPNDDFQRLASAFNSLSKRIQQQIGSLKEERNEKEAILESLGEGVIAVDGKMQVLYINFIACKMLGCPRRSLLNKPFGGDGPKINQELMQKCKALLQECQEKGDILTSSLAFGGEKKTYIDLIAAPKAHGTGAIIVLQDKSSHYRSLEMGKDFVANASHELRTPITIIKGYAETLHDMPDMSKEMHKEITDKITRNCARMESLVHNLLTLADIENLAENRFQECGLIALLENCRHTLRSVYQETEVTIQTQLDKLIIHADPGLLELAFINLLDNAAKYSGPPAKITIDISTSEEEEAIVKINDQGRGIPPEDLDHIFERFYRVDKTHSRRLGGAGLGLSIVKTIITKHDGTIEVSSKLGEGTTFTVTLPVRHYGRL